LLPAKNRALKAGQPNHYMSCHIFPLLSEPLCPHLCHNGLLMPEFVTMLQPDALQVHGLAMAVAAVAAHLFQ
jgi:hypothetical protein